MTNRIGLWIVTAILLAEPAARAAVHEVRIPLQDGKLSLPHLTEALTEQLGLPGVAWGSTTVDVQGIGGSLFVSALNKALGEGCNVAVDRDALVLRVDPDKLPQNLAEAKSATRVFASEAAPEATAKQKQQYGLKLPKQVDASKRLVILVHGVDCTRDCLQPMADLLDQEGHQVAFFGYPDDQAIADSAAAFTDELKSVRETFPTVGIDVVSFSMGGLVARGCIEGSDYPGGVGHLILLAPPNQGSKWAHVRLALELREQYELWQKADGWSPSWAITDGLGEAGGDLLPDSKFLKELNERPRRDGVKYTIVNGNVHPVVKTAGQLAEQTASAIGPTAASWLYVDQLATRLRNHRSSSDGPVSIQSTRLAGVEDVVTVRADHNGLYLPQNGQPPAAWDTVRDRLKK